MILGEASADDLVREGEKLSGEIHGDLSCQSDLTRPDVGFDLAFGQGVVVGDGGDDLVDIDFALLGASFFFFFLHLLTERQADVAFRLVDRDGEQESCEGPFQFADVLGIVRREILQHLVVDIVFRQGIGFHLLVQNGDEGVLVRIDDVDGKAARESTHESVLQPLELGRTSVGGQDDLLALRDKKVEDVEEHDLRVFFAGQKLDVVHQEDVDGVEEILEAFAVLLSFDETDELRKKVLACDVEDFALGMSDFVEVACGLEKMRLAESGFGVEEDRIVHRRFFDGEHAGEIGILVRGARDEVVEGELRKKTGIVEKGSCRPIDGGLSFEEGGTIRDFDFVMILGYFFQTLLDQRKVGGFDHRGVGGRVGDEESLVVFKGLQLEAFRGKHRVEKTDVCVFSDLRQELLEDIGSLFVF